MRLVVTGGSGFIGSNFIHHMFHSHGHGSCCEEFSEYFEITGAGAGEIHVLNIDKMTYAANSKFLNGVDELENYSFKRIDIADEVSVRKAFEEFRPDTIVHFAAESHVDRSIESGNIFVRTNVLGTQVLLDEARRIGVERFVHVSTDEVYGSIDHGSFSEDSRLNPASPYSASKASSDLLALSHFETYGLPVQVTRCTNNFGPNQHDEKLIPKIIDRVSKGETIPIYGDGSNVRDWLFVHDHCSAIVKVMGQKRFGEVFNIGSGVEKTNLEIVEIILEKMGVSDDLIEFVEDRLGHDWRYSLDDSKIRSLGWKPKFSFERGLQLTIDNLRK